MSFTNLRTFRNFLSNNRLFTLVTILGFAVALMFVLLLGVYVQQELSVDRFHKNRDRIYLLCSENNKAAFANSFADQIKNDNPEVESFTRLVSRNTPVYKRGSTEKIVTNVLYADSAFFNIFTLDLKEGRPSTVLETKQSAVITESYARKIFPGQDPVGQSLYLDDTTFVVIKGLMADMPENTQLPDCEIIFNYRMIESHWGKGILESWDNSSFTMYFMAREGTDLPSKAPQILEKAKKDYWMFTQGFSKELYFLPFMDVYFGGIQNYMVDTQSNSKTQVSVYLLITILILIVAILNYINLSVAQSGKRGKEAAMKKLLGCDKRELVTQFVSESVVLTAISFLVAVGLAFIAEPFFDDVLRTNLNLGHHFLDPWFILVVLAGIFIVGAAAGLIPAFVVSRFEPIEIVKGTYMRNVKGTYSKVLISFQYVVAFVLIACSAFIVKQTLFMRNYDMGFNQENILVMSNTIPGSRHQALRSELEKIPGVEMVSFSLGTPIDGGNNSSFEYKGEAMSFQYFAVDSLFFDLYGIQVESTGLTDGLWLNQKGYNALQPDSATHTISYENGYKQSVMGVMNDFHIKSLHDVVGPMMVTKLGGNWAWSISVKIAASADLFNTTQEIKRVYSDFNGGEPFDAVFVDEKVQQWYEGEEKTLKILTAFTILTFIILITGLFAMSLYFVQQKEKEIGIRKVNGAKEGEIIVMLNSNFLRWILLAFVISVPIIYFAIQKWLQGFAYKTTISWWIFLLTGTIVLLLSILCITLQTWKAATANPVDSLKSE